MPAFLHDPLTGRRVIIAPGRSRRPSDYGATREVICPFCPGNESETPLETLAYRSSGVANEPGWRVRIFPNKYPAVTGDAGVHEVIVETPDHSASLATMNPDDLTGALHATRERILALKKDPRWTSVFVFKNHGPASGATREHPHMQLLGLPFLPDQIVWELAAARRQFAASQQCPWCPQSDVETGAVFANDSFLARSPHAPRFPFETHLLPKRHCSNFELTRDSELPDLAQALQTVIGALHRTLRSPDYNAVLITGPLQGGPLEYYHWRIEILPRLGIMAGFEFGAGCHINSVPPEEAARRLRQAIQD